jgi:hypothetical protein
MVIALVLEFALHEFMATLIYDVGYFSRVHLFYASAGRVWYLLGLLVLKSLNHHVKLLDVFYRVLLALACHI